MRRVVTILLLWTGACWLVIGGLLRPVLPRGWLAVLAAALLALGLWGFVGTRRLVVRRIDLPLAGLPEGLEGMRVVQLSDLHVGPHTSRRHLARIAAAVR